MKKRIFIIKIFKILLLYYYYYYYYKIEQEIPIEYIGSYILIVTYI